MFKKVALATPERDTLPLPLNFVQMGAASEITLSLKKIKKEIKKIEILLEYKQKKKLINKILDIKYKEGQISESESESSEEESEIESESDMETSGSENESSDSEEEN
jgi:hypothetical protein